MRQIRKKISLITAVSVCFWVLTAFIYGPSWFLMNLPGHPAVDETRVGFIKEMKKQGYISGKNIDLDIETDAGNLLSLQRREDAIAKKEEKIFVAIGTAVAQGVKKNMSPHSQLVFSSVTDPKGAGLVQDLSTPEGNVTGVSTFVHAAPQLRFFKLITSGMKRIGFVYNPEEQNSMRILEDVKSAVQELDLELIEIVVSKKEDVRAAVEKVGKNVDAFYVNNDNTASGGWGSIVLVADELKIPAYSADPSLASSANGGIAAYGVDHEEVGRQTALMVIKLLNNTKISDIPVVMVTAEKKVINLGKAKELGISIPKDVLDSVDRRYPENWWDELKRWVTELFVSRTAAAS